MNIGEIVKKYLKDNGYDGLVSDDMECGCELKDLCPCHENCFLCVPGHKQEDPTKGADFLIYPGKKGSGDEQRS